MLSGRLVHQIETNSVPSGESEGTTKAVFKDIVSYLQSKQGTGAGKVLVKTVHEVMTQYMQ